MVNKKNGLQVLWWIGLYFFWIMVFQKREFAFSRTATIELCYLLFIAANFYFNITYTIPNYLYRKRYLGFILLFIAGIVATALLRVPLALYLNAHYFLVGKEQPAMATLFINSLLNIFIWTACLVAGKIVIERFRFQQYFDEVTKQKEQAELDFLNAQFNPHFLFNSINSIYGTIDKQNTTARTMLLTFSDMLRYQLYDCNSSLIAIEKETDYIKNYIALQKVRKEDTIEVAVAIDENVKGFSIAPLLFIAFIENAFKFVSTSETKANQVIIALKKEHDVLHFKCYNTKDLTWNAGIEHKGIGIANAHRRLALLYPKKHDLDISNNDQFYEVHLKITLP